MTHLTVKMIMVGVAAVALAACSSGGANTNGGYAPKPNTRAPIKVKDLSIQGNRLVIPTKRQYDPNAFHAGFNQHIYGASSIDTIEIDGKRVLFNANDIAGSQETFYDVDGLMRIGGGKDYLQHSRFGFAREGGNDQVLFSQGKVTTNMPTTGRAIYTGKAAHVEDGKVYLTKAQFGVDYGAKILVGEIATRVGKPNIELTAKIHGNSFSGTEAGMSTNGYFYGNDAAELGGTYRNRLGTVSGAYGAKKEQ